MGLKKLSRAIIVACVAMILTVGTQAKADRYWSSEQLKRAEELFDKQMYRAAAEELKKSKAQVEPIEYGERLRIEYLLARCEAESSRDGYALRVFIEENPHTIYTIEAKLAMGDWFYDREIYEAAVVYYRGVEIYSLQQEQFDKYSFRIGYCYFESGRYDDAYQQFAPLKHTKIYGADSRYYSAYIDYQRGDIKGAKRGFVELQEVEPYSKVIPYYLLQIELAERNYDYVIAQGEKMIVADTGEKRAEIARALAEAWFSREDYGKAERYMAVYESDGGKLGRSENYIWGYCAFKLENYKGAISRLERVVGVDDSMTQNAAYALGSSYLKTGDKSRAMAAFSMAAGDGYDAKIEEDALFNYAKLKYELGGDVFSEAINVLTRYIEKYPDSPRKHIAREYLATAYYNSSNYDAAYEAIKLIPDPDNNTKAARQRIAYFKAIELYNSGDLSGAMRIFEEASGSRYDHKYGALIDFWRAEIHMQRGEWSDAKPLYLSYINSAPKGSQEYRWAEYGLGYANYHLKADSDAKMWFTRYVATNAAVGADYLADAHSRIGDIAYMERDFKGALSSYRAGKKVGGEGKYYAEYQEAMVLGVQGDSKSKVKLLDQIVSRGEGGYVEQALYEMGRDYVARFETAKGIEKLEKFVGEYQDSPKYMDALSDLGVAYQNRKEYRKALEYYQKIVERAPQSPDARGALVAIESIYVEMDDLDGYFDFAKRSGVETDVAELRRDSLSFVAAQNIYMSPKREKEAIESLSGYLDRFPRGRYRAEALSYLADGYTAQADGDNAIARLKQLADMQSDQHTVSALERLANLCFKEKRYEEAASANERLTEANLSLEAKQRAWRGYWNSVKATEDMVKIGEASQKVLSGSGAESWVVREAKFERAKALGRAADEQGAIRLYEELAKEVESVQGAESNYLVIEQLFNEGELKAAETRVLEFAKKSTPHTYWLGRAFLILGDIYIEQGDNFQARATLQSVVDGYLPLDDGIVEAAKKRVAKIGEK